MQIDIISDTVCPWCYIGKRKFERALELFRGQNPGVEIEVCWRPFQLDPTTPREGVDRREHIRKKFGEGPGVKAAGQRITQVGAEEGITFVFDKIERSPNTLDSHRLIHWAGSAGCQDQVVEALFNAYFEEARDIGNPEVLIEIATSAGMETDLVQELLNGDADLDLVAKEDLQAREMGIGGVPTFIVDSKYPVSGAQEPDTLLHFFTRAYEIAQKQE